MKDLLKRLKKLKNVKEAEALIQEEQKRLLHTYGTDPKDAEMQISNNIIYLLQNSIADPKLSLKLYRIFKRWINPPEKPKKKKGGRRRVNWKRPKFRYTGSGYSPRMLKWIKMGRPPMWQRQAAYYGKDEWAFLDLDHSSAIMRLTVIKNDEEAFVGEGRDVVIVQNFAAIGDFFGGHPPTIYKRGDSLK